MEVFFWVDGVRGRFSIPYYNPLSHASSSFSPAARGYMKQQSYILKGLSRPETGMHLPATDISQDYPPPDNEKKSKGERKSSVKKKSRKSHLVIYLEI